MVTPVIKHSVQTGAPADPNALVDGPAWDAAHTVTGLENVQNVDQTNANNITKGTLSVPFSQTQVLAGPGTAVLPANLIESSDNAVMTASSTDYKGRYTPEGWGNVNGLTVNWETGSAGTFTGARTPILGNLFFSHASSPSNAAHYYAGAILTANVYTDDNGTSGTPAGVSYGLATVTYQKSTVQHWEGVWGYEADIICEAGSYTQNKVGIGAYLYTGDAVQGANIDAAFMAAGLAGTSGWRNGFQVGSGAGAPLSATGVAFSTFGSFTATSAIDVSSATFTGYLLKSAPLTITGQGAYKVVTGVLTGDVPAMWLTSGSATQHIYSSLGRNNTSDFITGVAANANEFMTGSAPGDGVVAHQGGNLLIGRLGSAPFLSVSATGAVAINGLTALSALATDANKNLVSVPNVGTGNNLLASTHKGYLSGLTLSTAGSSTSFGIAVGVAADTTAADVMALAVAITKTTAAWAVGSGNGALDTGAIANSTWYHVHLIKRTDTGVVDALVSLSASAPTMPASYTLARRIGSMMTDGSGNWKKFIQDGDLFEWDIPVQDVNGVANPGTTAILRTLSVPSGVNVLALIRGKTTVATTSTACATLFSDPAVTDTTPDFSGNGQQLSNTTLAPMATLQVRTNTSSQIRVRLSFSDASTNSFVTTEGWRDTRGK